MNDATSGRIIVGLLLAAGRGSRFSPDGSSNKLLATVNGDPVCVSSARALQAALPRVIAATAPRAPAIAEVLNQAGCEVLICDRADSGMGNTLSQAISQATIREEAAGNAMPAWCVMPADMPWLQAQTVTRLAQAWLALPLAQRRRAVLAPSYQGQRGHPVLFGPDWTSELSALQGDQGARAIIRGHLSLIEVDDPGCLLDVDTPSDLLRPSRPSALT